MIRWLGLKPSLYTGLLSFFRTSSWHLKGIQQRSLCDNYKCTARCLITKCYHYPTASNERFMEPAQTWAQRREPVGPLELSPCLAAGKICIEHPFQSRFMHRTWTGLNAASPGRTLSIAFDHMISQRPHGSINPRLTN